MGYALSMQDTRAIRIVSLVGVCSVALAVGASSKWLLAKRGEGALVPIVSPDEDLRDAVASPSMSIARVGGKSVPAAWLKNPQQHRADMTGALWASRRRRMLNSSRASQ